MKNNRKIYEDLLKTELHHYNNEHKFEIDEENNVNKYGVKLKSEMYNHDNEKIVRREEEEKKTISNNNKILVIGVTICMIMFITFIIIVALSR